jgi:hypothetical protein
MMCYGNYDLGHFRSILFAHFYVINILGGSGSNPRRQWRIRQRSVTERLYALVHGGSRESRRRRQVPLGVRSKPVARHRGWLHSPGRSSTTGT